MSASVSGRLPPRSRDDFRVVFAMTVWSAITLIAAVLISRRVGGAFRADMGAVAPCLAATAAVLFSLVANALWCAANSTASGRNQIVASAVTLIPPLALAAALWTSPSAFIGGYLAALFVLSALATIVIRDLSPSAAGRTRRFRTDMRKEPVPSPITDQRAGYPPRGDAAGASCPLDGAPEASDSLAVDERIDEEAGEGDPSILQWMTRRQLADGAEAVEGSVRIHFGPGERSAVAHVSFIPPLSDRPRAECQVLADFDGRVRIGVAQAYGLRIEGAPLRIRLPRNQHRRRVLRQRPRRPKRGGLSRQAEHVKSGEAVKGGKLTFLWPMRPLDDRSRGTLF